MVLGVFLGWKVRRLLRTSAEAAAGLGPRAAPHLVRALDDARLRRVAAGALLRLGAAARPALLRRLKVRKGALPAVEVLGKLRPRADVNPLLPFLRDSSAPMRRAATRAVARQGGSLALTALAGALGDPDPGVRRIALGRFTRTTDPRAIRHLVLLAARTDDEELARVASARILELGYLAVSPLVESLRTRDEALRTTVSYLFDGLNDQDSLVILAKALEEDDDRIVQPVREAFLRKGPEVAPALAPLAGHPDQRVRRTALGLLARWETPAGARSGHG